MSVPIKMKITKQKLQQIIKEEYQRALSEGEHDQDMDDFEQDMYPGADERGDPDNWDHSYDDDDRFKGYVTDEDRTQFLQAYNIIAKLTDLSEELRKNPTPDQEERIMREMRKLFDFDVLDPVDTAVFNMLGALGIYL